MPATIPACIDNLEASDRSTDHAVELFKAWLKCHPGLKWTDAFVDRYKGLTLITADRTTSLHFKTALCGYGGSGPRATIEILELAGFGRRADLEPTVHCHMACQFSR